VKELQQNAREKLQFQPLGGKEKMFERLYLEEITRWFKQNFFSWFDGIDCDRCNLPMVNSGLKQATSQHLADGASTVEWYILPYHNQP